MIPSRSCLPDVLFVPPAPLGLRLHLVSDLDGTWLPAPGRQPDLARLEAFLRREPGVVLTFATGRTLASARSALAGLDASLGSYLVTDVGTALFERGPDGDWQEWPDYAQWVAERWPGPAVAAALTGGLPQGVAVQPGVAPCRRLALETVGGRDPGSAALELSRCLAAAGVQAEPLASGHRLLDVLPPGVDKGAAITCLLNKRQLPRPLVVCGDSSNDLAMLRLADIAVLMADASLDPGAPGLDPGRLVRPGAPGPLGILEVLLALGGARP